MLRKHVENTEVAISGMLAGRMWWPMDRLEFDFNKTFTFKPRQRYITSSEVTDLRDALLRCQDSGDFQNLDFVGPVEVTVIRKVDFVDAMTDRIVKTEKRYRSFSVQPDNPEYKDLFE
jgi:hypothetical protein